MKTILILTAAILLMAPLAVAQGHDLGDQEELIIIKEKICFDGGPGGSGQVNLMECKEKLNLTDDQFTKLKALRFKHQNQMIDLRADLQKAQLNMRHEHGADLTKSKALSLNKEINRIEAAMSAAQIGHKFDVKDVLTKEQFEIWHQCQSACNTGGNFGGPGGKCGSGGKGGFGGHGSKGCDSKCGPGSRGSFGGHGGKGCDSKCGPGGKSGFGGHGSKACGSSCGSGCKSGGHGQLGGKGCDKHGAGGYKAGQACDKHVTETIIIEEHGSR